MAQWPNGPSNWIWSESSWEIMKKIILLYGRVNLILKMACFTSSLGNGLAKKTIPISRSSAFHEPKSYWKIDVLIHPQLTNPQVLETRWMHDISHEALHALPYLLLTNPHVLWCLIPSPCTKGTRVKSWKMPDWPIWLLNDPLSKTNSKWRSHFRVSHPNNRNTLNPGCFHWGPFFKIKKRKEEHVFQCFSIKMIHL